MVDVEAKKKYLRQLTLKATNKMVSVCLSDTEQETRVEFRRFRDIAIRSTDRTEYKMAVVQAYLHLQSLTFAQILELAESISDN